MDRATVLCTLPMHPAGRALLEPVAKLTVASDAAGATLASLLPGADYLVVRTALPADLLQRPHKLRAIVRHGTGLDMIPMEDATRQGIPVANVPGANAQAVAEYVVGSFFALARRFGSLDASLRREGWLAARARASGICELAGKTVGVVGVGQIGHRIAHACATGLGMNVLGYEPSTSTLPDHVRRVALDTLLAESDFVTLNCPLTDQTRGLLDARRLGLMKRSAFLVNTARGEVVDEAALTDALARGRIAGAAIDVYATQPLPQDHPYLGLERALLTPHVASLSEESVERMSLGTAHQILQLMRGERPEHLVNPEVWATWPHRAARLGER